jgi:hypothetical protein
MLTTALVLIDYQNIHLTAHDKWAPLGTPKHDTLVHPLHYANQVIATRNARLKPLIEQGQPLHLAELAAAVVYRGLPSNKHAATAYRRSQAQRSEWTRDKRVEVNYRPLKYHRAQGSFVAQEKGVDVMIALRLVRAAREGQYGVVILASHDTDLEPALDEACAVAPSVEIETTGWKDSKRLRAATPLWHTFLDSPEFIRSRDRKNYT